MNIHFIALFLTSPIQLDSDIQTDIIDNLCHFLQNSLILIGERWGWIKILEIFVTENEAHLGLGIGRARIQIKLSFIADSPLLLHLSVAITLLLSLITLNTFPCFPCHSRFSFLSYLLTSFLLFPLVIFLQPCIKCLCYSRLCTWPPHYSSHR